MTDRLSAKLVGQAFSLPALLLWNCRPDKIEKAGAVWVIGVSAPAVVTGI
jgi:hypothetical protein